MPATVHVTFDTPSSTRLTPRRLHAAWGHVLDLPPGVTPQQAQAHPALSHRPAHDLPGPKPYSLGLHEQTSDRLSVELRFLDDALISTLDAWLAWGGVMPIGDGSATTTHLIARDAHVINQTSWEELAATTEHTAWTIHLHTPTVTTSHGRHQDTITAASLATSLQARWHAWDPATCPTLPSRDKLTTLLTTQDHTQGCTVNLGMPRKDRRGRLSTRTIPARRGTLRVSGRPTTTSQVFSQLMALAQYTNVGSHTSYGMGVIDTIPDPA